MQIIAGINHYDSTREGKTRLLQVVGEGAKTERHHGAAGADGEGTRSLTEQERACPFSRSVCMLLRSAPIRHGITRFDSGMHAGIGRACPRGIHLASLDISGEQGIASSRTSHPARQTKDDQDMRSVTL